MVIDRINGRKRGRREARFGENVLLLVENLYEKPKGKKKD